MTEGEGHPVEVREPNHKKRIFNFIDGKLLSEALSISVERKG